jgi:WD40 repeat protein
LMVEDINTWNTLWSMHLIPLHPTSLALSPDNKNVAVGGITLGPGVSNRAQIVIVDLAARQIVRTIDNAFALGVGVERMEWSPDGSSLAVGARVGGSFKGPDAVKIFDAKTGDVVAEEPALAALVTALRYTANGKYLIEAGIDGAIRIWDGSHKNLLQTLPGRDCYALAVSRSGSYLAAGNGNRVTVWRLE